MERGVSDWAPGAAIASLHWKRMISVCQPDQGLLGFLSSLISTGLPILMVAPNRL
jgi:hypothetical protein